MHVACLICEAEIKVTVYRYRFTLNLKSRLPYKYRMLVRHPFNRKLAAQAAKQLIVFYLGGIFLSNNQPLWLWQYELLCCRSVQQRPSEMRHQHDYTVSCLPLIYCDSTNSLQNHVVRC